MKNILVRFGRIFVLVSLIVLFFVLMARIDFIVNSTLYSYGLVFSYEWASIYWFAYHAIFGVFSFMTSFVYWLGSKKTACDKRIAAALFLSINLLALGGLQDVIFFVLWNGGLPANSVIWTWVPWVNVFGTWNSTMQIMSTAVATGLSLLAWGLAFRQKKKTCEYPL